MKPAGHLRGGSARRRRAAVPLDVVSLARAARCRDRGLAGAGITHALPIERCGRSADGTRATCAARTSALIPRRSTTCLLAGPWRTSRSATAATRSAWARCRPALIARDVPHGETIACATPADHLIVAGVSNWGAYGAARRAGSDPRRTGALADRQSSTPTCDGAVLRAMVNDGPAVDGVTRQRTLTVDSLPAEAHHAKLRAIRAVAEAYAAG